MFAFPSEVGEKIANMEKADLEAMIAAGMSLQAIGRQVQRNPSTVSYWLDKYGLEAVNRERHAARGGIARAVLVAYIDAGQTIAEIAEAVGLSKGTVRHWLRRYGLRTGNTVGSRTKRQLAQAASTTSVTLDCAHHGTTDFQLEGRDYYRCKRCRTAAVARRRRKIKSILVHEAGGRCCICGYDRSMRALAFHHVDPLEKRLEINAKGVSLALDTLRVEARKCVRVCSNCHAEVEDGLQAIPLAPQNGLFAV
jgi:transposase-like protein